MNTLNRHILCTVICKESSPHGHKTPTYVGVLCPCGELSLQITVHNICLFSVFITGDRDRGCVATLPHQRHRALSEATTDTTLIRLSTPLPSTREFPTGYV